MPDFIFIQQISVLNILNMLVISIFFSSKCRLFHNATLFGFCIIHILNTGGAKIKKKIRRQKVKNCTSIIDIILSVGCVHCQVAALAVLHNINVERIISI